MSSRKFNCSQCGECCRHINMIPELKIFDKGNGECIHLKDNKCNIYENRPDVCQVDVMYEKVYFRLFTKEEFYKENEAVCNILNQIKKKSV